MGVEINYSNPDGHVPEAESNNRVIKQRFRIVYYRLPYTKIPRIIIRHLAMNVTWNLNFFPAKVGALDRYIPRMIISHSNWYYKKHFRVGFGAYIQASKVNLPNNKKLSKDT